MARLPICRGYGWFIVILLSSLIAGCGAKPAPVFDFEKDAVFLHYQADKELNLYGGQPHSAVLVVYQLSEVNAFNQHAGYRGGLVQLLSASHFDPSVTAVTKKYIEPGSSGVLTLDRAAHTQYVGIVCGFYELIPEKSAILVDVNYDTSRHGLLLKEKTTVNPLKTRLFLGKDVVRLMEEDNGS